MELCDGNLSNLIGIKSSKTDKISAPIMNISVIWFNRLDIKLQATRDIIKGCNHIHSCGVIHFDIKPANILYKRISSMEYVFKIADFGVSSSLILEIRNLKSFFSIQKSSILIHKK